MTESENYCEHRDWIMIDIDISTTVGLCRQCHLVRVRIRKEWLDFDGLLHLVDEIRRAVRMKGVEL